MTDLSPAAQAVLDAFNREAKPEPHHQREAIAAALRAAADQIDMKQPLGGTDADAGVFAAHSAINKWLLAIAAEMENE